MFTHPEQIPDPARLQSLIRDDLGEFSPEDLGELQRHLQTLVPKAVQYREESSRLFEKKCLTGLLQRCLAKNTQAETIMDRKPDPGIMVAPPQLSPSDSAAEDAPDTLPIPIDQQAQTPVFSWASISQETKSRIDNVEERYGMLMALLDSDIRPLLQKALALEEFDCRSLLTLHDTETIRHLLTLFWFAYQKASVRAMEARQQALRAEAEREKLKEDFRRSEIRHELWLKEIYRHTGSAASATQPDQSVWYHVFNHVHSLLLTIEPLTAEEGLDQACKTLCDRIKKYIHETLPDEPAPDQLTPESCQRELLRIKAGLAEGKKRHRVLFVRQESRYRHRQTPVSR